MCNTLHRWNKNARRIVYEDIELHIRKKSNQKLEDVLGNYWVNCSRQRESARIYIFLSCLYTSSITEGHTKSSLWVDFQYWLQRSIHSFLPRLPSWESEDYKSCSWCKVWRSPTHNTWSFKKAKFPLWVLICSIWFDISLQIFGIM